MEIQLNLNLILQGVIIMMLGAGIFWLFGLNSKITGLISDKKYTDKEIDKFTKHIEAAHIHPVQFESLAGEVRAMSTKMLLMWQEFEQAKKLTEDIKNAVDGIEKRGEKHI